MKKSLIYILITGVLILLGILVYTLYYNMQNGKEIDMSDKRVLIAYYSYSGNTKAAAEKIQKNIRKIIMK